MQVGCAKQGPTQSEPEMWLQKSCAKSTMILKNWEEHRCFRPKYSTARADMQRNGSMNASVPRHPTKTGPQYFVQMEAFLSRVASLSMFGLCLTVGSSRSSHHATDATLVR